MDYPPPNADGASPGSPARAAVSVGRRHLALVEPQGLFAPLAEPVPAAWQGALAALLGWLVPDRGIFAAAPLPAGGVAPAFAPWQGWAPAAWQHGGDRGLPDACWAASYLFDHGPGVSPAGGAVDTVLMSPLPRACAPADADGVALPHDDVLAAMLRAAQSEGRRRIALVVSAKQRRLLAQRSPVAASIVTVEEAIPALVNGGAGAWDAIITMPDLRGAVFALLAQGSGVAGAWPMLWHGAGSGDRLRLITSEIAGEGCAELPLDAPALVHALALALHRSGCGRAASRLHEGWTRLRDSGVTTSGRGANAPYVTTLSDMDFIATLAHGEVSGRRPVPVWRAINRAENAKVGSLSPVLRVISANAAVSAR